MHQRKLSVQLRNPFHMSQSPQSTGTPGWKVVLFVFLPLTAIVGSAFIFLAPIITAKEPGKLYVGIRFNNEATIRFMTFNEGNPLVRVSLFPIEAPIEAEPIASFFPARRGKNVFDVSALTDGQYRGLFECNGYHPITVALLLENGSFIPDPVLSSPEHVLIMDKFIGVFMQEI